MVTYKAGPNKEPGAGGGSNRSKKDQATDSMAMAIGKRIQKLTGGRTLNDQDVRLIKNALATNEKKASAFMKKTNKPPYKKRMMGGGKVMPKKKMMYGGKAKKK
tara:strand:+ start:309 stop:620 length:312 start_codon:yes stop_codon:yes gene_type:complete